MQGDLVRLRPLTDDDFKVVASWGTAIGRIYSQGSPSLMTAEQIKTLFATVPMNYLMVRTIEGDEPIGMINWSSMAYHDAYTLGIGIGNHKQWGGGYGMEAIFLLMEHLFHNLNAHRLQVDGGLHNKQVMQIFTSGFVRIEGVLRDYYFVDGEYHDAVIGSILRDEYYALVEALGYPRDTIPAEDKAEARRLVADFLTRNPLDLRPRQHRKPGTGR